MVRRRVGVDPVDDFLVIHHILQAALERLTQILRRERLLIEVEHGICVIVVRQVCAARRDGQKEVVAGEVGVDVDVFKRQVLILPVGEQLRQCLERQILRKVDAGIDLHAAWQRGERLPPQRQRLPLPRLQLLLGEVRRIFAEIPDESIARRLQTRDIALQPVQNAERHPAADGKASVLIPEQKRQLFRPESAAFGVHTGKVRARDAQCGEHLHRRGQVGRIPGLERVTPVDLHRAAVDGREEHQLRQQPQRQHGGEHPGRDARRAAAHLTARAAQLLLQPLRVRRRERRALLLDIGLQQAELLQLRLDLRDLLVAGRSAPIAAPQGFKVHSRPPPSPGADAGAPGTGAFSPRRGSCPSAAQSH